MTPLSARALKVTLVLDPTEVSRLDVPVASPRVMLRVRVPYRLVTADLAAKSVRKAQGAIREHGADGVAIVLQGRLVAAI